MRVSSAGDLGLFVQDYRMGKRLSQRELAEAAGVSRRWLANFETGKSSVELRLVIRTLNALDLALHVQSNAAVDGGGAIDNALRSLDRRAWPAA